MSNSWVSAWRGPWLAVVISSVVLSGCKLPDELLLPPTDPASPVQLTIGEFDTTVRAGEYANVSVSYADLDPAIYSLYVEITDGTHVASFVNSNATAMAGTLSLKMPIEWAAPAGNTYYVSLTAASNSDRNNTVVVTRKDKPILVTVPVPPPVVSITSIPQQVAAGTYLNLTLNQSSVNFATHALTVFLAKGLEHVGEVRIPATTLAQSTINLPVQWNAVPGAGYTVGWEVAPINGNSSDLRRLSKEDVGSMVTVSAPSIAAPSAVFESADSQILAGSVAKARLRFSNVATSATHDFVAYIAAADGSRFEALINARGTSTVDVTLPVPLTASAGSYVWSWAVVSKTGGWGDPMTAYAEDTTHMLQVSAAGSAVPTVTLSTLPATVAAGEYISVTLAHQNVDFSKYKLIVYLSNGAGAYEELDVPAAVSGSRVIKLPVPWTTAPADNFVLGWALTSITGGASDPTSLSQELSASPIKVVAAAMTVPAMKISPNYPTLMNAGEFADVEIEYSGVNFATHKLYVGVRDAAGAVGLVELTSGAASAKITVKVPIWWDTVPGSNYYVEMAAVDTVRDDWSDPKTVLIKAVTPAVTIKADPPMPLISVTSIPQTVKAGEYLTLSVSHTGVNPTTHELLIYLHSAEMPTIEASVPVATDGTASVKLPIQWAAPVGMEFQVEWVLLNRTIGFDDQLRTITYLYESSPITVTAATTTPPTLSFVSFDPTAEAGADVNATVDYSGVNFTTHDLFVAIANDNGVIAGLTQITQPTSGRKSVQIPVSISAPAGVYNIVLAALPRSGKSVAERVSDPMAAIVAASTGTVEITSSQPVANVTFVSYDQSVKAGEYLNATINYQNVNSQTHEVVVYIASSAGGHYEVPVPVSLGQNVSGAAIVKLPVPWTAHVGNDYALAWGVISKTGSWGDPRSLYRELPGVSIAVQAPLVAPPVLQINSYSTSVRAGAVFTVGVHYDGVNFGTHDLNIDITDGIEVYGRTTYTVADGLGPMATKNVAIEIDAAAPAGNAYYVQFSVVDKARGWNDPKSISVIAQNPKVTITR